MKPISNLLLQNIKETMDENNFDYKKHIENFQHIKNIELRNNGKQFSFESHLSGLIFSLLSSQRSWGAIEKNKEKIYEIFYNFDKNKILYTDWNVFESKIKDIKCGNRALRKQMKSLHYNIRVFEKISNEYGSLDKFVTSDSPYKVAKKLASGNKYKLKQIGFALALEYLKNVGIDAIKPDLHIIRILSHDRLDFSEGIASSDEAVSIIRNISRETGFSQSYIDALLWVFCANDYANICSSEPKCNICKLSLYCNYHKIK